MWFAEIQIDAIRSLRKGWDSYGADPPDEPTLEAGRSLLWSLSEVVEIPKPHIYPTRSGGIQFEWELDGRYIELEVDSPQTATWYFCDEKTHAEEEGTLRVSDSLEEIVVLILRVVA